MHVYFVVVGHWRGKVWRMRVFPTGASADNLKLRPKFFGLEHRG